MTEATWTAALLRKLRKQYPSGDFHKVNERIQGGRPDGLLTLDGATIHVEFKGPDTPVTPLQRRTIKKLRDAGATVLVVRFNRDGTNRIEEGAGYRNELPLERFLEHVRYNTVTMNERTAFLT